MRGEHALSVLAVQSETQILFGPSDVQPYRGAQAPHHSQQPRAPATKQQIIHVSCQQEQGHRSAVQCSAVQNSAEQNRTRTREPKSLLSTTTKACSSDHGSSPLAGWSTPLRVRYLLSSWKAVSSVGVSE